MAQRFPLIHNTNFKRVGIKSYVQSLLKYNIGPTLEGPYVKTARVAQRGNAAIHSRTGQKVGGRAHVKGHVLAKKTGSGSSTEVPAEDVESNAEYLVSVSIGTPAQKLTLDFDTGSSDLWVWSTELPSTTTSGGSHDLFNPTKSSTYKTSSGETWNITYGDGSSASGDIGTDNVTIGTITVKNQAIELAKTLSSSFQSGPGDGLLGLAWPSINTAKPKQVATPVENMISQGLLPSGSQLFTVWLGSVAPGTASGSGSGSSTGSAESFYTFGEIDQTSLAGQTPAYAAVDNSQGFWSFQSTSAKVGSDTIALSGNTAIADTGTTLCLVSDTLCQAVYKAIGGSYNSSQQGYTFPTSTDLSSAPQIQVAVGDSFFTINPENLPFEDLGDGTYYGGIQSRGDETFDIFGDVFLRSVYAIFDQGGVRFGAVQRPSTLTGSGSGSGTGTGTGSGSGSGSGSGTNPPTTGGGSGSGSVPPTGTHGSHHHHHHHHGHTDKQDL